MQPLPSASDVRHLPLEPISGRLTQAAATTLHRGSKILVHC